MGQLVGWPSLKTRPWVIDGALHLQDQHTVRRASDAFHRPTTASAEGSHRTGAKVWLTAYRIAFRVLFCTCPRELHSDVHWSTKLWLALCVIDWVPLEWSFLSRRHVTDTKCMRGQNCIRDRVGASQRDGPHLCPSRWVEHRSNHCIVLPYSRWTSRDGQKLLWRSIYLRPSWGQGSFCSLLFWKG